MKKHNPDNFSMNEVQNDLQRMERFLQQEVLQSEDWMTTFEDLLDYQDEDGSFKLFVHNRIPSDARVDFCFQPTYIMACAMIRVLLEGSYSNMDQVKAALANALFYATHRGLEGHGYESFDGLLDTLELFLDNGLVEYLELHPSLSVVFNNMILTIENRLQASVKDMGNPDHAARSSNILDQLNKLGNKVFVYGTLMQGQSRHQALAANRFHGNAILSDVDMYDLGSFPAIVPGSNHVLGEVYGVDQDTLRNLDRIEGEGNLYERKTVTVQLHTGAIVKCFTYFFKDISQMEHTRRVPGELQSYRSLEDYLWYVSYGSNLLFERFRVYLDGKPSIRLNQERSGCVRKDMPLACAYVQLPYPVYFARRSPRWNWSGVAFLDTHGTGNALGKAYLVHRSQFHDLQVQEGWYPKLVRLKPILGIEACTFTADIKHDPVTPSDQYRMIMREGLAEHYSASAAQDYVTQIAKGVVT